MLEPTLTRNNHSHASHSTNTNGSNSRSGAEQELHNNMMGLVVLMTMMRLAALAVSFLSALVADGRSTQTACGAIDPNGRPTVANGRPAQTPCGTIDPNGRPTVANDRPAQTPCGAHSTHEQTVQQASL